MSKNSDNHFLCEQHWGQTELTRVITKPDGTFVSIMKDRINNTSVQNALKGIGK